MRKGRYRASLVGVIAQALKGYVGHQAIISELLQNADDAGSSTVSFHFTPDRLELRNDSYFTQNDWDNIVEVASGGKHDEEGKIGAFGTGFISVYHITDQPEIFSAGRYLTLKPLDEETEEGQDSIGNTTIFRFPWRRKDSYLSRRIESHSWDDERIREFLQAARHFIPEAFLFLRHVRQIDVFDGEHLAVSIKRTKSEERSATNCTCEVWQIEQNGQSQSWLYYYAENKRDTPGNLKIKDRRVSLAFPISGKPVSGKLYNFLPTQIETGYAFHINGAFFPDNNRRGVLDDIETNPERTLWNHSVIDATANLFRSNIIDIRDQFMKYSRSPNDFYQLWPLKEITERYNLAAVRERFIKEAKTTEVIYNSLGSWERPDRVWVADTPNLHKLAADYLSLLPDDAAALKTFVRQYLGAKTLTLRAMLTQIKNDLRSHIPLDQAHPLLNTRERLTKLYEELPQRGPADFDWVREQPIFLSEAGTLMAASQIWQADLNVRDLFNKTDRPPFADAEFEVRWPIGYVMPFKGAELVNWLWTWHQEHSDSIYFDNIDHLKRVLSIISDDIERADRPKLRQLFIVRVEGSEQWYSSVTTIFFARNPFDYKLGIPNLLLVERTLAQDAKVKKVYEAAGIQALQPSAVIDRLKDIVRNGLDIDLVKPLYHYFGREQLSPQDIGTLGKLPIYLTANGRWVALSQQPDLSLKPKVQFRAWNEVSGVLDKLQLDSFIHHDLESETGFLSKLGIKPLDEMTFNRRLIEQHYSSPLLNDNDRHTLLDYLRDSIIEPDSDLLPIMQSAALILGDDGQYRRAKDAYFASPLLDEVFESAYPRPHSDYGLEVASSGDENQTPYHRNRWYRFFSQLGMLEEPHPTDVIERVRQLTATQPNNSSIVAVQRIIEYLNTLSEKKLADYLQLSSLAWLPAQGDNKEWHLPTSIYEKRHEKLIGQQAPLLRLEVKPNVRRTLRLPERPDGDLVARHLITCMQSGTLTDDGSVYRHLGKFWDEVEVHNQQHIRNEASIWERDKKRYWKPANCYIGEQEQLYFGDFRHYRAAEADDSDIGRFYQQVGIREKATNDQRMDFLREIAASSVLLDDKRPLLIANLRLIGGDIESYREIVAGCRQIRIVPDENGNLHRADRIILDDQPGLREKFSGVDLPFVPKDFYEEAIVKFWDSIGVTHLSTAKPIIVEIKGKKPSEALKQRLADRIPYLKRIIHHKRGSSELAYNLNYLRVFMCDQLHTRYEIIQVTSSDEPEAVAFDRETDSLYHRNDMKNIQLARKLIEILYLDGVVDAPTIEVLLDKELAELDPYLNDAGYKSLPQDALAMSKPTIPLAKPSESSEDSFGDEETETQDTEQEHDNEIDTYDEEYPGEDEQRQDSGFSSGWGSSSHAPHYPNSPEELVDRFGVEQEFPKVESIVFLDDFDEENSNFDQELQIAEDDFPDTWEEAFPNESKDTWSGLSSQFSQSGPHEFFWDAWNLQRELPEPEDRKGVFQVICEAFPQDGAVMHISEIRSAVWERRRDIAEGTISSILSRAAPCFERLVDGYWKFHAKYIEAGYRNLNDAVSVSRKWAHATYGGGSQPTGRNNNRAGSPDRTKSNSVVTPSKTNGMIPSFETDDVLSSGLLIDLETFLGHIPSDAQERQHDILRRTALSSEHEKRYDLALVLYELLHKRGIKGFEKKIHELRQLVPLTEIAERISRMAHDDPNRWELWRDAWLKYPKSITLRDMIRNDVRLTSAKIDQTANEFIRDATEEVAQECIAWLKLIYSTSSAWHQDEIIVLGKMVPLVFEWLIRKEHVNIAVELIANLPPKSHLLQDAKFIDMNRYLYAVEVIVDWLSKHKRQRAANVLQAYGSYVAKSSGQKLISVEKVERQMYSSQVSINDLRYAEQDESIRSLINLQMLEKMIEQYQ